MSEITNIFLAAAEAQHAQGEDVEVIARELATAFRSFVQKNTDDSHLEE